QQLLAELGETVAARLARHQRAPDATLQLGEAARHGRLVDTERPARGQRAAVLGHGQQVAQVVPVEHRHRLRHARTRPRFCNLGAVAARGARLVWCRQAAATGARPPHPGDAMTTATTTISTDPRAQKAAIRDQWDRCAAGWDAHGQALRHWLARATEAMLDMAGIASGMQVLDVAAGAGEQTLDIARRVGPTGGVVATDLSPAILAFTQQHAARDGLSQVRTQVAHGETLPFESACFE